MRKEPWLRGQAKPGEWSQKQWQRRTSGEEDWVLVKELTECALLVFRTARTRDCYVFFIQSFLNWSTYFCYTMHGSPLYVGCMHIWKGHVIHLFSPQILPGKQTHTWVAAPEHLTWRASSLPRFYLVNTILGFEFMPNWMRCGGTGWAHSFCGKNINYFWLQNEVAD